MTVHEVFVHSHVSVFRCIDPRSIGPSPESEVGAPLRDVGVLPTQLRRSKGGNFPLAFSEELHAPLLSAQDLCVRLRYGQAINILTPQGAMGTPQPA
jgi:hypothetical protein